MWDMLPALLLLLARGVRLVAEGIVSAARLGVSMKPGTGGQGGNWGYVASQGWFWWGLPCWGACTSLRAWERGMAGSRPRGEVAAPSWR